MSYFANLESSPWLILAIILVLLIGFKIFFYLMKKTLKLAVGCVLIVILLIGAFFLL